MISTATDVACGGLYRCKRRVGQPVDPISSGLESPHPLDARGISCRLGITDYYADRGSALCPPCDVLNAFRHHRSLRRSPSTSASTSPSKLATECRESLYFPFKTGRGTSPTTSTSPSKLAPVLQKILYFPFKTGGTFDTSPLLPLQNWPLYGPIPLLPLQNWRHGRRAPSTSPSKLAARLGVRPLLPLQNWLLIREGASTSPSKLARIPKVFLYFPFKTGPSRMSTPLLPLQNWPSLYVCASTSPSKLATSTWACLYFPFKTGTYILPLPLLPLQNWLVWEDVPLLPLQNWPQRRVRASTSPSKLADRGGGCLYFPFKTGLFVIILPSTSPSKLAGSC